MYTSQSPLHHHPAEGISHMHQLCINISPLGHVCMMQSIGHARTGAQTLQLRDNYRSTPQVLRGAEGVLNNLLSTGSTPERVVLNPLLDGGPQIQVTYHIPVLLYTRYTSPPDPVGSASCVNCSKALLLSRTSLFCGIVRYQRALQARLLWPSE